MVFLGVRLDFCKICIVFLCLFVLNCTSGVRAATLYGTACDVETWEVLKNRAWMEGEREVEMAQVLILKPDSVLEYSCFNQRRAELSGDYFSRWTQQGGTEDHGVGFLGRLVRSIIQYVADLIGNSADGWGAIIADLIQLGVTNLTNVSYDFVNYLILGTWNDSPTNVGGALGGHLQNFSHSLAGGLHDGSYDAATPCDAMNRVWDFVRCNGGLNLNSFVTFDTLIANPDIRSVPPYQIGATSAVTPSATYSMPPICPDVVSDARHDSWVDAMDLAYPPALEPPEEGGMHRLHVQAGRLATAECADPANPPVPTGIMVQTSPPGNYDPDTEVQQGRYLDAICVAPGCHYVPFRLGGDVTGRCEPN